MSDSNVLRSTINSIFEQNNTLLAGQEKAQTTGKKKRKNTADLELALTVLLVDLASCDQAFEPQEYQVISNGLMRIFGTSKSNVQSLVNRAQSTLQNLRGVDRFGAMLRQNLTEEEKRATLEIIDEVIQSDGITDGFEVYLREKFCNLLGLSTASSDS